MLKINYPLNAEQVNTLYNDYLELFPDAETKMQSELGNLFKNPLLQGIKTPVVKEILVAQVETLLAISLELNTVMDDSDVKRKKLKNELKKIFNYDGSGVEETKAKGTKKPAGKKYQPDIAKFFMDQSVLDISTCFYCNVDYINSFNTINEFRTGLDLAKRGTKEDLKSVEGIGEKVANDIINLRPKFKELEELKTLGIPEKLIENIEAKKGRIKNNQFTLDHVLNKARHPVAALSLYNFVPCCSNCNSKFKRSQELVTDRADLSPTSKDYSFPDNVRFKLYLSWDKKGFNDIADNKDFFLDFEITKDQAAYQEYLRIFKLRARYFFHKREALSLIIKRKSYSDSQIAEIARLTDKSISQVTKDLFGEELFERTCDAKPLTKLKRDISKEIGIPGVL